MTREVEKGGVKRKEMKVMGKLGGVFRRFLEGPAGSSPPASAADGGIGCTRCSCTRGHPVTWTRLCGSHHALLR